MEWSGLWSGPWSGLWSGLWSPEDWATYVGHDTIHSWKNNSRVSDGVKPTGAEESVD